MLRLALASAVVAANDLETFGKTAELFRVTIDTKEMTEKLEPIVKEH